MSKYLQAETEAKDGSLPPDPPPAVAVDIRRRVTVGKLAVFLSQFVAADDSALASSSNNNSNNNTSSSGSSSASSVPATTAEERDALCFLVQSSGDGRPTPSEGGRSYWARRFYSFLGTVCELKSMAKDEAALGDAGACS